MARYGKAAGKIVKKRGAADEERHAAEREVGTRRASDEPEAGDRDWIVGGTQEGRESSSAEVSRC